MQKTKDKIIGIMTSEQFMAAKAYHGENISILDQKTTEAIYGCEVEKGMLCVCVHTNWDIDSILNFCPYALYGAPMEF